jgi:hypothetical protein
MAACKESVRKVDSDGELSLMSVAGTYHPHCQADTSGMRGTASRRTPTLTVKCARG